MTDGFREKVFTYDPDGQIYVVKHVNASILESVIAENFPSIPNQKYGPS